MTAEVLRSAAFIEDGRGGDPAGVVLDAARLVVGLDPATRSVRVSGAATRLALSPYDELEALC